MPAKTTTSFCFNGKDLTGLTFGKLTVIRFEKKVGAGQGSKAKWRCKCVCGGTSIVFGANLSRGHTRSCGCVFHGPNVKNTTHGHTRGFSPTRTYRSWSNMKKRCLNPKDRAFPDYGGRGIKVCKRWGRFENFLSDMGECPEGLFLERINNNSGYFKSNCKWATMREQSRNRRSNVHITHNGKTMLMVDWAVEVGLPYKTIAHRIALGWGTSRALTRPLRTWPGPIHP